MSVTEHLAAYKWKPGQCGNPNGRPKDLLSPQLRMLAEQEIETEHGLVTRGELLASMIWRMVFDDNELWQMRAMCLKLLIERIDPIPRPTVASVQNVLVEMPGMSSLARKIIDAGRDGVPTTQRVLQELRSLANQEADGNGKPPTDC